jgi:hypothetical protein
MIYFYIPIIFFVTYFLLVYSVEIKSPIHFVSVCIFTVLSIVLLDRSQREQYDPYAYDYDRENPNALISGRAIGGSVYTAYPQNAPGLGWIL